MSNNDYCSGCIGYGCTECNVWRDNNDGGFFHQEDGTIKEEKKEDK